MESRAGTGEEGWELRLSLRDWAVTGFLVAAMLAVVPRIPFRPRVPVVERDYRIPYALSTRYDVYRRFTRLAAAQFHTILVGDSVVWGQSALRDQTLSHHLNVMTKQSRFANAGLDGMHPIALAELIEHHAPALERKDVILQLDPLWLMITADSSMGSIEEALSNRPGLAPRLAADVSGVLEEYIESGTSRILHRIGITSALEEFTDSKMDFLAWSLNHPYESPLKAISTALPPSEDLHQQRLVPWKQTESAKIDCNWPTLENHPQWQAFLRTLNLLERRSNRVFVLLGPMNEHMMSAPMLDGWVRLKKEIRDKLAARGTLCFAPSPLRSEHYSDICHPLGPGYEDLARELIRSESAWMLGGREPH